MVTFVSEECIASIFMVRNHLQDDTASQRKRPHLHRLDNFKSIFLRSFFSRTFFLHFSYWLFLSVCSMSTEVNTLSRITSCLSEFKICLRSEKRENGEGLWITKSQTVCPSRFIRPTFLQECFPFLSSWSMISSSDLLAPLACGGNMPE